MVEIGMPKGVAARDLVAQHLALLDTGPLGLVPELPTAAAAPQPRRARPASLRTRRRSARTGSCPADRAW